MSDSLSATTPLWAEGTWAGAVTPYGAILLPAEVPETTVEELWTLLRTPGPSLTEVLDRLVRGAGGHLARIPDFALVILGARGVSAAVRGAPVLQVDGEQMDAIAVSTWREAFISTPGSVTLSAPEDAGQVLRPAVDAILRVSRVHLGAPVRPAPSPTGAGAVPTPVEGLGTAVPRAPQAPATRLRRSRNASVPSPVPSLLIQSAPVPSPASSPAPAPEPVAAPEPAPVPAVPSPAVVPAGVAVSPEGAAPATGEIPAVPPGAVEPSEPVQEERPGDHDGWTLAALPEDLVDELGGMVVEDAAPETSQAEARMALSVMCPDGHANPTNYVHCRTCGAELSQPARLIPCPPLGHVLVSAGGSVELDRPVLVGRQPEPQEVSQLAGVTPALVTVPSPELLISRNHLLIELDEWSVLARSLSTSNGTTLRRDGAAPMRLAGTEAVLLTNGDILDLGDGQSLVLEDLP
ncbi:MAG: FHA domain-containing protein [Actinomyces sp.]|uniref:FHA domain-containing protein n=1 Tax=Actinomyces sp. TaxID=29317 RepID=UPI0026DA91E5|nr:FHA domain-containing protein [Actinomyces sp.]MDO4243489.1 FHA domain-containing protein [Actinomyces sp.]